jgi:quercetin dioxygenase-like cupin family protein
MSRLLKLGASATLMMAVPTLAQAPEPAETPHHAIFQEADIEWQAGPPSLPPGAQFAVLEGDPSAEGYFALRIRMPDGYAIPPHWHPVQERVTVLSGTVLLGFGESMDREQAQHLAQGSYFTLAPHMPHFAMTAGEVVVQLTSMGPWEINYIDPSDDPRR